MENNQKRIRRFSIFAGVLLLVSYITFQSKNLILGPSLSITSPQNGSSVDEIFQIEGVAKKISAITLNDTPIFVDETGVFREKLIAPRGYSIIKVSVKDRFGRNKTEYLHLVNRDL